jgi:hypothetical protein
MNPTDEELKADKDAVDVRIFMDSLGGRKVLEVIQSSMDRYVAEMGNIERQHTPDFYAGAIYGLRNALTAIYGCISYGERVRVRAEESARAEVATERSRSTRFQGVPKPQRTRDAL